ncbi:MucR family transcriptional regulator [Tsukamurella tyrosinosolvens]|uniref:MucR family transcriptional regulator n=1 Tax=Tsukamurella tyrosinosolvens TaxID=57704 RepID=UPI002DD44980|nr:MucR family transcriptional regulator [Tsukamurella tyrosinosolvens]MEC4616432.1 MucR family transcriptional regulator [Tsukamurella tyrosinosolvens]
MGGSSVRQSGGRGEKRARVLAAAQQYFDEHGTLDGAVGELADGIARYRSDERLGVGSPEVAAFLDGLDPLWRLTEQERAARARDAGVEYLGHRQRRSARDWDRKLEAAGFTGWAGVLEWAYAEKLGTGQIVARVGAADNRVWVQLEKFLATDAGRAMTAAAMQSRPGQLARNDNGGGLQCPECGLWFTGLRSHVRRHGLTPDQFRTKWDLPPGTPLGTVLSGRAVGKHAPDHLDELVTAAGYADLDAAIADAYDRGESIEQLAVRLGVHQSTLRIATKHIAAAKQLRAPKTRETMLALARETAAAGIPLKGGPRELRVWMYSVRLRVRAGKPSPTAQELTRIDPDWF